MKTIFRLLVFLAIAITTSCATKTHELPFQKDCCEELNIVFNQKCKVDSALEKTTAVINSLDSTINVLRLENNFQSKCIDSLTTALSMSYLRIRRMHQYVMIYSKDSTQKVFLKGWFNRAIK